jgi:hypothetical protein
MRPPSMAAIAASLPFFKEVRQGHSVCHTEAAPDGVSWLAVSELAVATALMSEAISRNPWTYQRGPERYPRFIPETMYDKMIEADEDGKTHRVVMVALVAPAPHNSVKFGLEKAALFATARLWIEPQEQMDMRRILLELMRQYEEKRAKVCGPVYEFTQAGG